MSPSEIVLRRSRFAITLVTFFFMEFTSTFAAAEQPPVPSRNAASSDLALLKRLEAAEAELLYLRQRDREREAWEQNIVRRLPAMPTTYADEESTTIAFDDCSCDNCGEGWHVCQGVGPLCEACEEKLSWNKGPWRIVPFGFLTGEAVSSSSATVSRPIMLYLQSDRGSADDQFTVHGQTTALGFNFSGPQVGNFQVGGRILFNFLGDRPALNQATPFFLRGYGELRNEKWRFTFGQQGDLFNPIDPLTVNFGGHKQAGNGGAFRGSLRAERYFFPCDNVQWTLQAALSQQVVTDFVVNPFVVGEDNGWPNIESRVGLGLGPATAGVRPVELGASGVLGETRAFGPLGTGVFTTWGITADARFSHGRWGMGGEFFYGQALGTYNLGIGQSLEANGFNAIRTVGGWGDISYQLTPCLTARVGYGVDDPVNSDLGQFLDPNTFAPIAGQRARNQIIWGNLIWDVTEQFEVAFEVSHRETAYIAPSVSNEAILYHFRARLKF